MMISSDIVHFADIFGKMDDELKSIIVFNFDRTKQRFFVFFFQNFKTNHKKSIIIIILQLEFLI